MTIQVENQMRKQNSRGKCFEPFQAVTSTIFSIAVLTRIGGVLQLNQDKELTAPQNSVHISLVREMLFKERTTAKERGTQGHGYSGWAARVTLARVRRQRVKCCPRKAEGLRAGTSQMSTTLQRRFHSHLTDCSERTHTFCSSHFQQSMHSIWKTL